MAGKKTQGRKKIKMKKIENDGARRITFSKRRSGLFKKASELSTLCGVQIAILVYSIGGKAFSFGHPSVESLIDRFENVYQPQRQDYITRFANSIREVRLEALNHKINRLNDKMAHERKETKMLRKIFKRRFGCQSFQDYLENLGSDKLLQVKEKLQMLKENLIHGVKEKVLHQPSVSLIGQIEDGGSPIPQDWLKL